MQTGIFKELPFTVTNDQETVSIKLEDAQALALDLAGADMEILYNIGSEPPSKVMARFIKSIPPTYRIEK